MEYSGEEQEFNQEEIENIIKDAIVKTLAEVDYNQSKVDVWSNSILSDCLKELQNLNKQYKYAITCIIMQKVGAGLDTVASFFWEPGKDGFCRISWNNNTLHAIVAIYGVSLTIEDPHEEY